MKEENLNNYIDREEKIKELEFDFIENMTLLRKEKKLSQQQLANNCGVIRETIARIENSMTSPQLNTLIKILESMDYTIKIEPINK